MTSPMEQAQDLFDYQDEFEIAVFEDGEPIFDDPKSRVVLLHDQTGGGAMHVWCSPEAAARGGFCGVQVTASST